MSDPSNKRRRQPYSRLICVGCRGRRIRCNLPDITISPSSEPQPPEKACQRCAQNGLDCVVDFTTLGRPAQKRNRSEQQASTEPPITSQSSKELQTATDFEDDVVQDVEGFLLSQQESDLEAQTVTAHPTKAEMIEANFSPYHLLPALLARDERFASNIGSQPLVQSSVIELIDEETTTLLDSHLIWHKLYYPDIPQLNTLRNETQSLERGHPARPSSLFLLTLLYDLALDVPSVVLASCRSLQPAVRALLYHTGQQLLFSLGRTTETVLGLVLAASYRPLVFTSSQFAAAAALRAVPYALLARQVALELGYDTAATRLSEALQGFETDVDVLARLMHQCLHWVQLTIAHETISNRSVDKVFQFRPPDASTAECVEALNMASLLGRIPVKLLLPYTSICGMYHMLTTLTEMSEKWRDLGWLAQSIKSHEAYGEREQEAIANVLANEQAPPDLSNAIASLAAANHHVYHNGVKGCALFFAVMYGAHAGSNQTNVQPDQAMELSNDIIDQLKIQDKDDPHRPTALKFMIEFGHTRIDELELDLANFVTAADSLVLNGVSYVGPLRQCATLVLFTAKDIVEQQAARLKGWGGLQERIDVQMILFQEVARRLEAMSASAGTPESLSKGCILTATAKLIRNLHRILQGFKKSVMNQRRSTSTSSKQSITPVSNTSTTEELTDVDSTNAAGVDEDLFADWQNWPQFQQFDPSDFSDLFGNVFDWDPEAL